MSIRSRSKPMLLLLVLAAAACSKKADPDADASATGTAETAVEVAAPAPAANARFEATKTFQARCSVCHGEKGAGDGPGSAALDPKPRNYKDAAWQNSVTDDQIRSVILMGGAAVGKSPIMPASPDLQSKPEVVDELVKIVRGFKQG